jgi:hypothetical protein
MQIDTDTLRSYLKASRKPSFPEYEMNLEIIERWEAERIENRSEKVKAEIEYQNSIQNPSQF